MPGARVSTRLQNRPLPKQNEMNRNGSETTLRRLPGTMEPMFIAIHNPFGTEATPTRDNRAARGRQRWTTQKTSHRIVSNTGTVSLRLSGFSLNNSGVQFNPSMSRSQQATHRTRVAAGFDCVSSRLF